MQLARHILRPATLLMLAGSLLAGCGGASKRAAGEFGVSIHNDTGDAVQVQLCEQWSKDRNCRSFFDDDPPSQDLAAGTHATVLVHAETARGKGNAVPGIVRFVAPKTGSEIGCIPYRITSAPSRTEPLRFDVSQAHACDDNTRVRPATVDAN